MNNDNAFKILESAVSDCGYWRYWVESNTGLQLEFGGVQIYTPPGAPTSPPSGLLAVHLTQPKALATLVRAKYEPGPPSDWFDRLADDRIDPFTIEHGAFTLSDRSMVKEFFDEADDRHWVYGDRDALLNAGGEGILAFWAGNVGFVGVADSVEFYTMSGALELEDVEARCSRWWAYWREYWEKRDGPSPLPRDYACEVTIPAAG